MRLTYSSVWFLLRALYELFIFQHDTIPSPQVHRSNRARYHLRNLDKTPRGHKKPNIKCVCEQAESEKPRACFPFHDRIQFNFRYRYREVNWSLRAHTQRQSYKTTTTGLSLSQAASKLSPCHYALRLCNLALLPSLQR